MDVRIITGGRRYPRDLRLTTGSGNQTRDPRDGSYDTTCYYPSPSQRISNLNSDYVGHPKLVQPVHNLSAFLNGLPVKQRKILGTKLLPRNLRGRETPRYGPHTGFCPNSTWI